jgi:predicted GIY-YIG superfamily endonuclease
MHPAYLLRSLAEPKQTYIGLTDDMQARLKSHNDSANFHAAKYCPWELAWRRRPHAYGRRST